MPNIKPKAVIDNIPVWCAHDAIVDIEALTGNPRNPNVHPDSQIDALAKIIKHQGWRCPITVSNRSGFIVRGHGRLMAARKLNLKQVPVDRQDYGNEAAEWADLIADNRIPELSSTDDALLRELLADIKETDLDMDLTGFDMSDIDELLNDGEGNGNGDPDDIPDVQEEPKSKTGDLYILGGKHRVLCGDSTSREDVEKLMDGKKADMVFTDPPYGVSYADKNTFLNEIDKGNRNQRKIQNDHQNPIEMKKIWVNSFINMLNASNDTCSYYMPAPQGGDQMMMIALEESGWAVKHELIWVKNNHVLGRSDYNYKHEPIIYGWKKKGTHKFYARDFQISIWEIDKPLKNDLHPTMKPVELIEKAVNNSSLSNHIILDLFLGSGSTLIACEKTGRICAGIEIEPIYIDVIVSRYVKFTGNNKIIKNGQEMEWTL